MQVVILAGGFGTRLAEETTIRPKPMVEIGEHPILLHIMKYYSSFGIDDFFIALGYKGDVIKQFFLNYREKNSSFKINLNQNIIEFFDNSTVNWNVNFIDTGLMTSTGGRLKRMQPFLQRETFMLTYGDGVSTVDLDALLAFHKSHGQLVTITAVRPPARFGGLDIENDVVKAFDEKSQIREGWINGGFMVLEPEVFDEIEGDQSVLEADVMPRLAAEGKVHAYKHHGFWQCMDTLRDKRYLDEMWSTGAPWKVW